MKSPLTKLTAAAVMIIAALPLMLFLDRGVTPVYALEHTIEANRTIKTIHLRIAEGGQHIENNEFSDCWIKYDDAGLVSNFRCNIYEDAEEHAYAVWNDGILKTWRPSQNVVIIIRVNDMEKYWEHFAREYDPKLIFQWLYVSRKNAAAQLHINEPAEDSNSIYVTATHAVDNTRLKLVIDPETKLVKELFKYHLGEEEDKLDTQIKVMAYNQSIDPYMFELSGIPEDTLVIDQIDQRVGLEQGNLMNDEIVVKVVRETLEAAIAKDYEKVSRLMEGDSGHTIDELIEEEFDAKLVRVTSIGEPIPHERSGYHIYVPCEIEVENAEKGKWTVNIIAMTEFICYQTGRRWVMHRPEKDDGSHISTNITMNAQDSMGDRLIVPGERIGDFRFGISKDEVLRRLGKPKLIFLGGEEYTLNNLPNRYYMAFKNISFRIDGNIVKEITAYSPLYKFTNGLGVGDSEEKIKRAFGGDFQLEEFETMNFLTYEDKGLTFEIDKKSGTVEEINVTQTKGHQKNRDMLESSKVIIPSEKTSEPIMFAKIDRKPKSDRGNRRVMNSLAKYDPDSDNPFQVDCRCRDLSKLDLSHSIDDLLYATFDDRTIWPASDKMPREFDWPKIMEQGKNPGLSIRRLHEKGITGRGVGVAILDQPLLVDHQEYAERVRLYEEIDLQGRTDPAMHGAAVASIALGKTVGVALEAELYYIAKYNFDRKGKVTMRYIAQGINRILEINEQLPKDNKIRVISISRGWGPSSNGYDDVMAACEKAKAAGVFIVSCSLERVYGFNFHGLGRHPSTDPDLFESYEPGLWWAKGFYNRRTGFDSDRLLVPMDSRTTASPADSDEYVFYRQGGWSWSVPYIAGVYALVAQVEPDITPERFWNLALKTGRTIQLEHEGEKRPFGLIIDPVKLIGSISEAEAASQQATSNHTIVPGVRIGAYTLDMSKDDVLSKLGEPEAIQLGPEEVNIVRRGQDKYDLNNLPKEYILYFGDVSFWMGNSSIEAISVSSPLFKLGNGVGVGDSVQKIKQVFGEDFRTEEILGKDLIGYLARGLAFIIHKKNRTVTEILVFRPEGDDRDVDSTRPNVEPQVIMPGVGVSDYTLGMSKDDVLKKLGKPENIFWGEERNTLDHLPARYFMTYGDISFMIEDNSVTGIGIHRPFYKFANGLAVGDSEEKIKQVFGSDFELHESQWKDALTYKEKGLQFEIDKTSRTIEEIGMFQPEGHRSDVPKPKLNRRDELMAYEDVSSKDLSTFDLHYSDDILDTLEFNQKTKWPPPERLPEGFDPQVLLEEGMNPGLGVRTLHAQGITGAGIHVGLIDQPLLLDHPEYEGKIVSYHSDCGSHKTSMHGPAMASQIVGKRCGTAPGASLHVVAVPSWKTDASYYARALDRLIEYNENAPKEQKIRVVSVSCQPSGEGSVFKNERLWDEAVQRAQAKGILVLDCTWHHGFVSLCWLDPEDRENVEACTPGFRLGEVEVDVGHIHVPSAPRTTAQAGEDRSFGYTYDGGGRRSRRPKAKNGYSDTIPYTAGILALGWQICPDLTPTQMKELLFASAYIHESGTKIIYPKAFIDIVRKYSGVQQHTQTQKISAIKLSKQPPGPITFPKIDRHPAGEDFGRGALESLPRHDPKSTENWQVDLRGRDVSRLDLRKSLDDLLYADFDSRTTWPMPDRMPEGFDRERIMKLGKNPGLGVRKVHERGITGRGIGIAIVDQPLLTKHQEYADRLRLYEEINVKPGSDAAMHGAAVASIALGKTVGVAPEADLYYIGSWTGDWGKGEDGFEWNFAYYAQSVRRILEINEQLPDDRKIRVISMSVGWSSRRKGYDEMTAAVEEAKKAGMLIVCSCIDDVHGFVFDGLGRAPLDDPDDFPSYKPGGWLAEGFYRDRRKWNQLWVPMDSRTTAAPNGVDEYVFYRQGGWSWAIPYVAGVYALAAQVDPEITSERFWKLAMKSGRTVEVEHEGRKYELGPIVDPGALIDALNDN